MKKDQTTGLDDKAADRVYSELTYREREVAALFASGMTYREIGAELTLATGTVRNMARVITEKMGVVNRVQAAVFIARRPLLEKALGEQAGRRLEKKMLKNRLKEIQA